MRFTIEEISLMCIFDTSSRIELITDLLAAKEHIEDPELYDIASSCIDKLTAYSDEAFLELDLTTDFD